MNDFTPMFGQSLVVTATERLLSCSVVSLEWAGPGVGGSVIFPFSVSVGLALKLLFTNVFVSVSGGDGNEGEEFH